MRVVRREGGLVVVATKAAAEKGGVTVAGVRELAQRVAEAAGAAVTKKAGWGKR